jgi:hypothetical protein
MELLYRPIRTSSWLLTNRCTSNATSLYNIDVCIHRMGMFEKKLYAILTQSSGPSTDLLEPLFAGTLIRCYRLSSNIRKTCRSSLCYELTMNSSCWANSTPVFSTLYQEAFDVHIFAVKSLNIKSSNEWLPANFARPLCCVSSVASQPQGEYVISIFIAASVSSYIYEVS